MIDEFMTPQCCILIVIIIALVFYCFFYKEENMVTVPDQVKQFTDYRAFALPEGARAPRSGM